MEMSQQLEIFLGRAQLKGHPPRHFLAAIHRGDAFTKIFSISLSVLVWIFGLTFGLGWSLGWWRVYYEFERWELILAFVDQFFLLTVVITLLYVTYLRAGHLRRVPPGNFVSLQAMALILRWVGECVLILAIGYLGHALLRVPEPGWFFSFLGSGLQAGEGDLKAGVKAWSLFSSSPLQISGFFIFAISYALASTIDVFIAIERNTRSENSSRIKAGELNSRGQEFEVS